ncbi:MAG: methyltransferase domain-containing protein [Deltaproteobacteria bacterium]|nr:methyltransferase domain-containing protein [Deltaproteobacteria bacterium]MBW2361421.1 methyltransferase domain-containing protein [Deltaproteobacteria bacterium]
MTPTSILREKEQASGDFFDGWAEGYEDRRISPWFQYTQTLAIDALDLKPESRALDVGCGTGFGVRTMALRVPDGRACGIDISPGMVEQACRRIPPELAGRVEIQHANSADIPYPDATFTHVMCTNSFHHYPEPVAVLREMQRVLVPGGRIVIFENAPDLSLYTRLWDLALRFYETGHVKYYTSRELREILEAAGLEQCELLALRNEFRSHGKLFASIQLWSARTPARGAA